MELNTCTSRLPQRQNESLKQKKSIPSIYGDWLNSIGWDYYCTFTTDYTLSIPSARRAMNRLFNELLIDFGKVDYFWVAEPFDCKDGYHTHALIKVPHYVNDMAAKTIENKWHQVTKIKNKRGKHRTHIMNYIQDKGAHYYLGKYLNRLNSDYDFSISSLV